MRTAPSTAPRAGRPGRGPSRPVAAAAAALVAAWAAGHALLNSPPVLDLLRARAQGLLWERLGAQAPSGSFAVDWLGRVSFGPVAVPASRAGRPPVVRVDRVLVSPRWTALLAGRAEPGLVHLSGVRVEAGPHAEEARALWERLGGGPRARTGGGPAPVETEIRLSGLVLAFGRVEFGPLAGSLRRSGRELRAELILPDGGRMELERRGAEIRAEVAGVTAEDLPASLREALPFAIAGGSLDGRLETASGPARTSSASFRLRARDVVVESERLAAGPVGPVSADLEGTVRWDAGAGYASMAGWLTLGEPGGLPVQLAAEVELPGEPRFAVEANLERVDFQAAVAALPPQLAPPAGAPQPSGPVSGRLALAGPLRRPAEWKFEGALDLAELRRAARGDGKDALAGTFAYRPEGGDGPAREILVGPENPGFVPLPELPPHVARAVLLSEDAGFYFHSGFDFAEMRNALAAGAEAGHLVRGASTITQQLAKNLFLSRERTLSRKAREALLTLALEAELPKARLLEIYLNIVEWGPDVYGIGEAARHYFGKDARSLTPKEAAFLAAVIPSPIRHHAQFVRGELSESFRERVDGLLLRMASFGQLTDEELREALEQPVVFRRG
jgi:hypothetical protein